MDARTIELLRAFAQHANTSKLLPEDWRRLFDLTVYVHRQGILMTGQTVRLHLLESGFSPDASSRLGWMFELFCQLLSRYDESKVRS